jgi:hypothetical protein
VALGPASRAHRAAHAHHNTQVKLAIFDDYRLGLVSADESQIADVTDALPSPHDPRPFGAGCWLRLCGDFPTLRPKLQAALGSARSLPVNSVSLQAPVLMPGKIVCGGRQLRCASRRNEGDFPTSQLHEVHSA